MSSERSEGDVRRGVCSGIASVRDRVRKKDQVEEEVERAQRGRHSTNGGVLGLLASGLGLRGAIENLFSRAIGTKSLHDMVKSPKTSA